MKISEEWRNWSQEKIDKEYSPSKYSKRLSPEGVIQAHIAAIEKGYMKAKELGSLKIDFSYGPTECQKLDILGNVKTMKGRPILAFIHGGYWQELDKSQGSFVVFPLVQEAACHVVLVGYDLAPKAKIGEIVSQVQNAAKYVVDMAKSQGSCGVYFAGHSAGGHLAAMIATSNWLNEDDVAKNLIKGYICISGIYDLRPLVRTYVNEPLQMTEQEAEANSPIFKLDVIAINISKTCQFAVIIGENESPEFKRQSSDFVEALKENNISEKHMVIPNVDHFDIIEKLSDKNFILMKEIIGMIKYNPAE